MSAQTCAADRAFTCLCLAGEALAPPLQALLARACRELAAHLRPGLRRARERWLRAHRQRARALFFGPRACLAPLAPRWRAPDLHILEVATSFRITARTGRLVLRERLLSVHGDQHILTVVHFPTRAGAAGRFVQFYTTPGAAAAPDDLKIDAFRAPIELVTYLRRWTVMGLCYWPCEQVDAYLGMMRALRARTDFT